MSTRARNTADIVEDVSVELASKLDLAGGKILQTISAAKTDTFTESVASGATSGDVTGLTATITPANTNNKVLVIVHILGAAEGGNVMYPVLFRAGSVVSGAIGGTASNRARVSSTAGIFNDNYVSVGSFTYLDSPSSASALTYSVRLRHGSGNTRVVYVNRSVTDTDNSTIARYMSSITVMEVSA